jgi:hypothetical protein
MDAVLDSLPTLSQEDYHVVMRPIAAILDSLHGAHDR